MKFNSARYFIFFLLICLNAGVSAQEKRAADGLQQIADHEKAAYSKLMQPHESLIVNNYDLKYHRSLCRSFQFNDKRFGNLLFRGYTIRYGKHPV